MAETIPVTIRLTVEANEQLKQLAKETGKTQGDLIATLLKENDLSKEKPDGMETSVSENNKFKLLIKNNNAFLNIFNESKVFSFEGKWIWAMPQPRPFLRFSKENFKNELLGEHSKELDLYNTNKYATWYQCGVYEVHGIEQGPFLIYEYVYVSDEEFDMEMVNIKRITFAKNLNAIKLYLKKYIGVSETEGIEYILSEEIGHSEQELTKYATIAQ